MVDVRGDVLRPPHYTAPAAVKANEKKMSSFKSNENICKKDEGSYCLISANKASMWDWQVSKKFILLNNLG